MKDSTYYINEIRQAKINYLAFLSIKYSEEIHEFMVLKIGEGYKTKERITYKNLLHELCYKQESMDIKVGKDFLNIRMDGQGRVIGVQDATSGFFIFSGVTQDA